MSIYLGGQSLPGNIYLGNQQLGTLYNGAGLIFTGSAVAPAPPIATGGTITYEGIFTVHTFTTSGSFVVNTNTTMNYLLVGGGGGGYYAGGSGGQVITGSAIINAGTYPIVIGQGGVNSDLNTVGLACYGTNTTGLGLTANLGFGVVYTPEWGTWVGGGNAYIPCTGVRLNSYNPGAGAGASGCASTGSPNGVNGVEVTVANRSAVRYGAGGRSSASGGNNGLGYGNPGSGGSGGTGFPLTGNDFGQNGVAIIWYVTP
jgi:hypothetical protein